MNTYTVKVEVEFDVNSLSKRGAVSTVRTMIRAAFGEYVRRVGTPRAEHVRKVDTVLGGLSCRRR